MDDSERAAPAGAALRIPRARPAGALLLSAAAQNKKATRGWLFAFVSLAERGGFEPPIGYEPIHAFQACDFNHSSTSPASFLPFREAAHYSKNSKDHKAIYRRLRTPL